MKGAEPGERTAHTSGLHPVARDPLVERVASGAFRKSNRLRELFLFLCERSQSDPNGAVREQDIGVAVFGRQPDYDTAQDAIVRVQVSQLRKRLEQYFASEGHDEPVIIEIPKGTYTPVFRSSPPDSPRELSESHAYRSRRTWLIAASAAGFLLLAAAVALWPVRSHPAEARASVDRLWEQMFDNGRPTCIILSDANLGLFEDAIHRQLTLNEYRDKEFTRLGNELLADPAERARWRSVVSQYFTHISDARLAATFMSLNAARSLPTEIVFAQDFGVPYVQSHNLILLGTRRTNPWLDLFEDQLNFRSGFQETPTMLSYFQNRAPQAGESAMYAVSWQKQGYCRVAFLPSPPRTGSVLVISGTDMASSEAGGQFVSSERWVRALSSTLGLSGKARFPYFEILLKVDYITWNTPKFDIVAHRSLKF